MRSFFATVALVSLAAAQTEFDQAQWDYEYTDSVYSTTSQGADWDYGTCASGTTQSPINLTTDGASNNDVVAVAWTADGTDPQINYGTEGDEEGGVSWSWTLQEALSDRNGNNQVVVTNNDGDAATYQTRNMRFRSPSEHTIDGSHLAAELQVFFTDETAGTHVLSYLIDTADADSEDLTTFIASETEQEGWFAIDSDGYSEFNFADLLTFNSDFWTYSGSLTDENCDEGVTWTVFKEFLYITEGQLDVLQSRMLDDADTYTGNNRVVQTGDKIADITVYQDNDTYEIAQFTDYVFADETSCTADVDDCAEEAECETDDEDCEDDEESDDDGECETDDEDCEDDEESDEECEEGDEDCEESCDPDDPFCVDDEEESDDDDEAVDDDIDGAFGLAASTTAAIAMAAVIAF